MGDTWIPVSKEQTYEPYQLLDNLSTPFFFEWQEVGRERVNGFDTVHYYRAQVELPAGSTTGFWELGMESKFRSSRFEGDVYIAEEGLLVKAVYRLVHTVEAQGKTIQITEEMRYKLEGVNLGLIIESP